MLSNAQQALNFFEQKNEDSEYVVRKIENSNTKELILNFHYARRMPSISFAYGLFLNGELEGVVTFGQPASPRVCDGIAGKENARLVLELNRLVLRNNRKNEASRLVGQALRMLPKPKIIISYADTAQKHLGVVYQATNFDYYGLSEIRTDRVFIDGTKQKHGRHVISTDIENLHERTKLVERPRKHRYVKIIANKTIQKRLMQQIKYEKKRYPKN
jgi:hypothetical protein